MKGLNDLAVPHMAAVRTLIMYIKQLQLSKHMELKVANTAVHSLQQVQANVNVYKKGCLLPFLAAFKYIYWSTVISANVCNIH